MKKILFMLCIVTVLVIAGCKTQVSCPALAKICPDGSSVGIVGPNCEFAECPGNNMQIANPASVNCIEKGGTLKIVDGTGGQYGICTLADGTECEEWAYFRGECPRNCSACPVFSPPGPDFCKEGRIVSSIIDACGCNLAPTCELIACTMDAKMCPDGTYVGRVAPNCEFAVCPPYNPDLGEKTYCTAKQKMAQICTMQHDPVCGWFSQEIKCIKYPCAATYGNSCEACASPNVEYWTQGECPK